MCSFGVVESMKDFYWDIRPKPEFGTIEIRVCDTPLTLDRAVQLAAYAQTLAAWFLDTPPAEADADQTCVYAFNRFQACRFGLTGNLILGASHSATLKDHVLETLDRLTPYAEALNTRGALDELRGYVCHQPSDADWLRQRYADTASLNHVVRLACARWLS